MKTSKCLPKILIVEDEVLVGWSLLTILTKKNFEVTVAETGEKACELIAANHYDLVISDVNLPHIDGFEVARYLKHVSPSTPIAIMSTMDDHSTENAPNSVKIDQFIEKPFDIAEISQIITDILLPK
ncbi:MAG: response regulator [Bacteroidota bacterium]